MVSTPRSRPPTPGRSPSQQQPEDGSPLMTSTEEGASSRLPPPPAPSQRRSSFGFLRRSKSGETMSRRSASGAKISKKRQPSSQEMQQELEQQELSRRQQEAASRLPPALPALESPPPIHTFGGESSNTPSPGGAGSRPKDRYMMYSDPPTAPPSVPIPPIPDMASRFQEGRTSSITHRGRYSYASSMVSTVNSPRRVRRRKDPTPFNVLVVGAKNSGKTSFLNFLRTSLALKPKKRKGPLGSEEFERKDVSGSRNLHPTFVAQYLETEIDGERVGLTLWDSEGLEKSIVDLQLREMNAFLESKFEETFTEEMKVVRAPSMQDTHIHCVFLVLDPARLDATIAAVVKSRTAEKGGEEMARRNGNATGTNEVIGALEEDLDVQVLRALQGKTTVVPIISKADTVTTSHMAYLKRAVWSSLKKARLDLLEALGGEDDGGDDDDDDEDEEVDGRRSTNNRRNGGNDDHEGDGDNEEEEDTGSEILIRQSNVDDHSNTLPPLPLSILSPEDSSSSLVADYDPYDHGDNTINNNNNDGMMNSKVGRKFPWGFADPNNPDHCDFPRLKEAVFVDWRRDLRVASREMWYERWRTERLRGAGGVGGGGGGGGVGGRR